MKRKRGDNEKKGKTPLHSAVETGSLEQCRLLLATETDLDGRNEYDQSALDIAVWKGDAAITRLLITAGGSVHTLNKSNQTVLRLAAEHLFTHMDMMKGLKPDLHQPTYFEFAQLMEDNEIVKKRRIEFADDKALLEPRPSDTDNKLNEGDGATSTDDKKHNENDVASSKDTNKHNVNDDVSSQDDKNCAGNDMASSKDMKDDNERNENEDDYHDNDMEYGEYYLSDESSPSSSHYDVLSGEDASYGEYADEYENDDDDYNCWFEDDNDETDDWDASIASEDELDEDDSASSNVDNEHHKDDDASSKVDNEHHKDDDASSKVDNEHYEDYKAYLETFRVLLVSGADPNTFWDPDTNQTLLSKAAQEGYVEPCKLLLLAGADPNILDGLRNTALHLAAQRDNEEVCKLLLIAETVIDAANQMGRTALHLAAHRNYTGICELLIREGANTCAEDESGESPIFIAVTCGHYESTQVILDSRQIDIGQKYENFEERTLLHLASKNGHADICDLLVDAFGDNSCINQTDKDHRTPLHLATLGNHVKTCELLLSKQADLTCEDKDKMTPLHHAAKENNDAVLETLITNAREKFSHEQQLLQQFVNAADTNGNTSFHFAMKKAKYEVYKPLLECHANPLIKNQAGVSPFLVAIQNAKIADIDIVFKMLLGHSYDVKHINDDTDSEGNTSLHIAARKDKRPVCESLVNTHGIDVTAMNKNGYVPLHFAATLKRPGICKFLLDKHDDLDNMVNARGKDGVSPLHMASQRGSDKVCKLLLDRGSGVNAEDQKGDTPLHYAARRGDDKICVVLVKGGADALAANKNGDIPEDLWPEENRYTAKTLKRERRNQANEELMKTGERSIDIVKLFLVGHPSAGKTTLKNSMDQEKYMVEKDSYTPTPGITVEQKPVGAAGHFSVWDCAGQMEYHVTHGMFLGSQNAIFLVVYDLSQEGSKTDQKPPKLCQLDEIFYWLAFVKAVNKYLDGKKPQVVLVATHLDIIPDNLKDQYRNLATENVKLAQEKFKKYLDISGHVFILGKLYDMTDFHTNLESLADSLRRTRKIKGLCYKIVQIKDTWKTPGPPILPFLEYCYKVKQLLDGISERLIRAATIDLHDMGMIYRAHMRRNGEVVDDFIVLDPNWLFSTIVGRLFAGSNMPSSLPKLEIKRLYTSHEICTVLEIPNIDVRLLMEFMMHLDLAVPFEEVEDEYLIPAKLPSEMDSHSWSQNPEPPCNEIYGRRMQCRDDIIDIYTPTTFPCIQAKFMKIHNRDVILVQNRLKLIASGMSVLVQMTRDQRGIDVIVRGSGEEERGLCYEKLQEALGIISTELEEHSPGTCTQVLYLSSSFLKENTPLSPEYIRIRAFTEHELAEAEKRHAGKVYHHDPMIHDKYEQVQNIVCLGYDTSI